MKKVHILVVGVVLLGLVFSAFIGGCATADTSELKVVTSTSLLAYIVEQVGNDHVDVFTIIPPAQHPGDFDARPDDIQKLAEASLFLVHGWPGETFVPDLVASAGNPDLTLVIVAVQGSWMTPQVQVEAADKVAAALSAADNENSAAYQRLAMEYKDRVSAEDSKIKDRLSEVNLSEINAICAFWQAGFLKWAGFNVIATYMDAEALTPQEVKELVDKGRASNVSLIVDNLQSGADAGKGLAEELDCKRVILSNFPGGYDDTEVWENAIDYNIDLLLEAVTN